MPKSARASLLTDTSTNNCSGGDEERERHSVVFSLSRHVGCLHRKLLQAVSYDPSGHKASQLHKMSPGEWKHSPKGADGERAVFWKEELGEARDSQGTPGARPLGRAGHAGPSPEGRP